MALVGAVVGLLAGVGGWMVVAGCTKRPVRTKAAASTVDVRSLMRRGGLPVIVFVATWALTGWPGAGVIAAAVTVVLPLLATARAARREANLRSEALAAWAEMLRDTITSHAGLREAIAVTAPVAPPSIRSNVQALSARAEREPLRTALQRFAADAADPVADLIVAALVIAADRQAQRLSELLGQIALTAREQSSMRLRVETGRARTYASARALVVITLTFAIGLLLFAPSFMSPYHRWAGQLVLMLVGALFAAAMVALLSMSRPATVPRLLAGVEEAGTP